MDADFQTGSLSQVLFRLSLTNTDRYMKKLGLNQLKSPYLCHERSILRQQCASRGDTRPALDLVGRWTAALPIGVAVVCFKALSQTIMKHTVSTKMLTIDMVLNGNVQISWVSMIRSTRESPLNEFTGFHG